ncbi:MAG TPA: helix-turn-helix domain-containing protein [Thermoplasmata archaeon]|nr:helix-turn-helix domain-containing protein [Thermoplasmata archaeon]
MSRSDLEPITGPTVAFVTCPIRASLGVLGRKWSLHVLRAIAFGAPAGRAEILAWRDGLAPRVLSRRLLELQREGLIEKVAGARAGPEVKYRLTAKGRDVVPVLAALLRYGSLHHAGEVFADRRPREIGKVFPGSERRGLRELRSFGS